MRELKFRAWDKLDKEFAQNIDCLLDMSVAERVFALDDEGGELVIEQYTGLKDKNGKEIYEGDILDDGEGHVGKVLYNERIASFAYEWGICGSTFMGLYTSDMKVIGNIHENPELLEEKE